MQADAESCVERAQNRRTRSFQHWPSGIRVCFWRSDVPSVGSLPTMRQGSTRLLNKHKGAWLVLRQFWLRKRAEAKSHTKKLMAQSGSWCKVDSCGVHRNTCEISPNAKVCHSVETKEPRRELEHSQTSSQRVRPILLKDPSHDISAEDFFF